MALRGRTSTRPGHGTGPAKKVEAPKKVVETKTEAPPPVKKKGLFRRKKTD